MMPNEEIDASIWASVCKCVCVMCASAILVEKWLNCVASGSPKQSPERLFWAHNHVERAKWTTLQRFDWWIIHFRIGWNSLYQPINSWNKAEKHKHTPKAAVATVAAAAAAAKATQIQLWTQTRNSLILHIQHNVWLHLAV